MRRRAFLKLLGTSIATVALAARMRAPLYEAIEWSKPDLDTSAISMRWVQQFNVQSDVMPMRYDVIYGVGTLNHEFAVRIQDPPTFQQRMSDLVHRFLRAV